VAIYTLTQMRAVVPRNGEGVEDFQITSAINSASEEVFGIVGDNAEAQDSDLVTSAINNLAQAEVLDIIFPRDARREGSSQLVLRESAERKLGRYFQILAEQAGDQDPTTVDSPPAILTSLESGGAVYLPDVQY
jgi:hypothetical protein